MLEEQQIAALAEAGLLEDERGSRPPPASRRVVKRLKQIVVTEAGLATLRKEGADLACSICR